MITVADLMAALARRGSGDFLTTPYVEIPPCPRRLSEEEYRLSEVAAEAIDSLAMPGIRIDLTQDWNSLN